jgi:hypothetical protein
MRLKLEDRVGDEIQVLEVDRKNYN